MTILGTILTRCATVFTGAMMMFATYSANAGVMFFTDQAAFLGATGSTTLIDFEGIAPDAGFEVGTPFGAPIVIGGVSFDSTSATDSAILAGKDAGAGNPFDSALIGSGNGAPLAIDFSGAGPMIAAGGIFGDSDSAGSAAVLSLFGAGDVLLDTQNIIVGDMGAGEPHTFFGWTADGGDVIARITFDMTGQFESIDDIRFETAETVVAVSEVGTLAIFGVGLSALCFWRRRADLRENPA